MLFPSLILVVLKICSSLSIQITLTIAFYILHDTLLKCCCSIINVTYYHFRSTAMEDYTIHRVHFGKAGESLHPQEELQIGGLQSKAAPILK